MGGNRGSLSRLGNGQHLDDRSAGGEKIGAVGGYELI
jgi:hypothetical protein